MTFTVERTDGILLLGGTLELRDRGALWQRVGSELRRDADGLRINLTAVDRIDGASAAMLQSLRTEAAARGGEGQGGEGEGCEGTHDCVTILARRWTGTSEPPIKTRSAKRKNRPSSPMVSAR